jgi:hypothetical protein
MLQVDELLWSTIAEASNTLLDPEEDYLSVSRASAFCAARTHVRILRRQSNTATSDVALKVQSFSFPFETLFIEQFHRWRVGIDLRPRYVV